MANPQKENGYTVIANEILEKICSYRISGEEHLVMWTIIRKTYGFNKKEDHIALSQFSQITGMKKPTCQRAITKLVSKKIIEVIKKDNQRGNIYKFNKDFDKWEQLSKKITSKKEVIKKDNKVVIKKDNLGESKMIYTKEKIKERDTKEKIAPASGAPPKLFNFKEYLKEMENHKARHINVIGHYFEEKGIKFDTRDEANAAVKRHLRPAVEVSKFSDQKIVEATNEAKAQYKDLYTVETILKILTR
jgi:phage replication O-like protein O